MISIAFLLIFLVALDPGQRPEPGPEPGPELGRRRDLNGGHGAKKLIKLNVFQWFRSTGGTGVTKIVKIIDKY